MANSNDDKNNVGYLTGIILFIVAIAYGGWWWVLFFLAVFGI